MKEVSRISAKLLMLAIATILFSEAANPHILKATGIEAPSVEAGASLPAAAPASPAAPGILRLHIVANSNSPEDQRVKLLVRDALLQNFAPAKSLSEAEELLLYGGEDILGTVEDVLQRENCPYSAQLRFGVLDFPDRTYDRVEYPAGPYKALRVELGTAVGENWWCVLFPPLCLVDAGISGISETNEIYFGSDIADWLIGNANPEEGDA